MSNTIKISDLSAKEAVAGFTTEAPLVQTVDRGWEPEFKQTSYMPGTSVRLRRPARYTAFSGEVATVEDTVEDEVTVTLEQFGVATRWTDQEKQLSLNPEKLTERVLKPMSQELVSKVETYIAEKMAKASLLDAGNTPGSVPGAYSVYADGRARLMEQRPPGSSSKEIYSAVTYTAEAKLLNNVKALPNPTSDIGNAFVKAMLKNIAGTNMFATPSIYRLANGTQANSDAWLINGVVAAGTSVVMKSGGVSKTWTEGAAFTIAGYYEVDPQTKAALPSLKVFRAASAGTTDGSEDGTVTITEAIVLTGSRTNVSGSGATDPAVTWLNGGTASASSYQNLIYHRRSFAFIALPLALPEISGLAKIRSYDGIPVKAEFWREGGNSKEYLRMDILIGGVATRGQWIATAWGE